MAENVYGFDDSKSKVTLKDGSGITVGEDGTIGHTNEVTAKTAYVGSATAVPRIKYDENGHITAVTTATIYPPTTPGEAGQLWTSDGNGAGSWKSPAEGKMSIVKFTNYSGTIPVMAGCKYSTDGNTWTEVTETGVIPTPFTGWVKFTTEVSGQGYTTRSEVFEPGVINGNDLSMEMYSPICLTTSNRVFVAYGDSIDYAIDILDLDGNLVKTVSTISNIRGGFVLDDTVYFISGNSTTPRLYSISDSGVKTNIGTFTLYASGYSPIAQFTLGDNVFVADYYTAVYCIDSNLNVTTVDSASANRSQTHCFVIGDTAHLVAGQLTTSNGSGCSNHDIYDANGVRTSGTAYPLKMRYGTAFALGGKGYILGGTSGSSNSYSPTTTVYILDENGNWTAGTSLSEGRMSLSAVTLGDRAYVIGGHKSGALSYSTSSAIDIYDTNGNRTNPVTLIQNRRGAGVCVMGEGKILVAGGSYGDSTNSNYVSLGTTEIIEPLNKYTYGLKVPVTEFTEYKIDGVGAIATADTSITQTKETKALSDPNHSWTYEFKYENGNVS